MWSSRTDCPSRLANNWPGHQICSALQGSPVLPQGPEVKLLVHAQATDGGLSATSALGSLGQLVAKHVRARVTRAASCAFQVARWPQEGATASAAGRVGNCGLTTRYLVPPGPGRQNEPKECLPVGVPRSALRARCYDQVHVPGLNRENGKNRALSPMTILEIA
jgi:hypothetical protein